MRYLFAATTLLSIFWFASCLPSTASAGEADGLTLTIQEARRLSDARLADRLATLLVQEMVDVDAISPNDEDLSALGLAFRPKRAWSGVCEAQVIQFQFRDPERRGAGQSLESLRETTRYKIRGNPDQNAVEDAAELSKLCGKDHPFKDGYFTAPDARTAQNAGFIVRSAQAQAQSGRLPFSLVCIPEDVCKTAVKRIGSGSTDRIVMVSEMDRCAAGQACVEIVFGGQERCYEIWSVTGRYRANPGQEWGMIAPHSIQLKTECPVPPL